MTDRRRGLRLNESTSTRPMLRSIPLAVLVAFLLSGCAAGDRIMDRAGRAAERAVGRQVDNRTDRAVDGAFNVGENAVRCAFNDDACIDRAARDGEDVVLVDGDGNYVDRSGRRVERGSQDAVIRGDGPSGPRPGEGANTGFDFTPGARTLFQDDFEGTRLGNVPGSIRFIKGDMEIIEDRGNNVLRLRPNSMFAVPMGEDPSLFTVEFDLYTESDAALSITRTAIDEYRGSSDMRTAGQAVAWMDMTAVRLGSGGYFSTTETAFIAPDDSRSGTGTFGDVPALAEGYVPIRMTLDGTYLKVYAGDTRVINIPNVEFDGNTDLVFFVTDESVRPEIQNVYIDNIRVGAGGQETGYAALATGGRVTASGVRFDSGSARLTGSSEAELGQILSALQGNSGLSIRIEGYTDSSGSADGNRRLSQQRADAVKAWLTGRGIAAGRLEARGFGEDNPVASNDTASGREQNRRVEIVGL